MDMEILNQISEAIIKQSKPDVVRGLVKEALDAGLTAQQVLMDGLLAGMAVIGERFKNNEIYVPQVLVSARGMKAGSEMLKPLLASEGVKASGRVVIGTVKGDLHDIGKNLVSMMMEGKGLEVVDLGTDVPPEKFIQAAIDNNAQIICCSALLTTTMSEMKHVVEKAVEMGVRDRVTIMVGGAPVNENFCKSIGADIYTPDAASASDAAVAAIKARG